MVGGGGGGGFFFQAEDGIRDLVRSRGLGDVYKRQVKAFAGGTKLMSTQVVTLDFHVTSECSQECPYCLSLIHI